DAPRGPGPVAAVVHRDVRRLVVGVLSGLGFCAAVGFARALDAALRLRVELGRVFHDARDPPVWLAFDSMRMRLHRGEMLGGRAAGVAARTPGDGCGVRRTAP